MTKQKIPNDSVAGCTAETIPIFIYMLFLNVKLRLMIYKCTLLLGDKDQASSRVTNFPCRDWGESTSHGLRLLLWTSEFKKEPSDTMSIHIAWKLTCVCKTENSLPLVWLFFFIILPLYSQGRGKGGHWGQLFASIHIALLSVQFS